MKKLANVWVFSDVVDRYAELLAGARQWGEHVYVVVADDTTAAAVKPLGADALYVLEAFSAQQRVENYAETLTGLVGNQTDTLILLSATKRGKALAARLSVLLKAAAVNDVTALRVDDGGPVAEHRMYGGLAFGSEKILSSIAIVTLAPGAVEPAAPIADHDCPLHSAGYVAPRHEILCQARRMKSLSSVDLAKAKRVVGVGRGLAVKDDLRMVEDLATALGAEVGCSRPVAEAEHWMERERYIGVSGVLLKADLYLALGISGQIQHMVGGNGAKTIVAVNKDKNAPIFNYADYGLVGDIYKVVPALIEQLGR
ncbi:electron transfer flavoprotein subunit alpha [Martelella alba]|uniref:Electron transfer flavoprotein subunit alpha n=1 Tax=Martelella alba TaxID=2590451 RepID=A0ABY2SFA1_9HYPH|nr:electron transfer flavoprotein subunit alpha [Martelella alba]TKI02930.1 electron transfer flavoprotein subunit alpha [Martelella alba]